MEESLTAYLLADAGLSAIVGSRLHWGVRPSGSALPAVAMYVVSGVPVDSDDEVSDLTETRIQFDCLGASFADAIAASRAIKAALVGKAIQYNDVAFDVFHDGERSDHSSEIAGESVHRVSVDLLFWHAN